MPSLAILPHQQSRNTTGKNASDIALVSAAMDLMSRGTLEGFCLVSSDSDFTRLAQRLREEGLVVYGFGERTAVEVLRSACTRFIHDENLMKDAAQEKKVEETQTRAGTAKMTAKAIGDPDDDGWENPARVGSRILGAQPDFDARSYGCANLSALAEKRPFCPGR